MSDQVRAEDQGEGGEEATQIIETLTMTTKGPETTVTGTHIMEEGTVGERRNTVVG